MKIRFIAVLTLMTVTAFAAAQTPDDHPVPPDEPQGQYGESAPSQPNVAAPKPSPVVSPVKPDSAGTPLPAFPAMRNIVATEKPVPGVSAGVIPKVRAAVSVEPETGSSPVASADPVEVAVLPPQGARPPQPGTPPAKKKSSEKFVEERSLFSVPTANFRTAKVIIDDEYNLVGMVYGEQVGYLHILDADVNGDFTETWKSPPLNGEIQGVFVENLDRTGEAEIVAYTSDGNIFIYGYDSHEMKFRTADGLYKGINCMLIANFDTSPERELLFITTAGKMIQFDPISKFEEWTSTETYTATDMVFGNVDNDRETELILNTGEVYNFQFKSLKWKMDPSRVGTNSRLYLTDVDRDGILELIVEYDQKYIRIFDVDQRHEKW